MLTNADVTIINRKRVDRSEALLKSCIRNVAWHSVSGATSGSASDNADSFKMRIPIDADFGGKTYVDRHTYGNLTLEEAVNHWTLDSGDIVVKGIVYEEEITQTLLMEKYNEVYRIGEFADNTDMGSDAIKHWRVGGS